MVRNEVLEAVGALNRFLIEINYELTDSERLKINSNAAITVMRHNIKASLDYSLKSLNRLNLVDLNQEEMSLLGFRYYEISDDVKIMMIPKWMTPLLKIGDSYTDNLGNTINILINGARPVSSFKSNTHLPFGNRIPTENI